MENNPPVLERGGVIRVLAHAHGSFPAAVSVREVMEIGEVLVAVAVVESGGDGDWWDFKRIKRWWWVAPLRERPCK